MIRTALLLAALLPASPAGAAELVNSHGLSPFGDLHYPKGFAHFDYVNPAAPKGGTIGLGTTTDTNTFNSFNPFILKGDTPEGLTLLDSDTGESLVFDCLMTRAGDEPGALYGLLAESVDLAPDHSRAVFHLRKEAHFNDGAPVRADDVTFMVNALKTKGHPSYRIVLRDVSVKTIDPLTVEFTFTGEAKRDLPMAVAELPIAEAAFFKTHPFEETTLDPPPGSGPYKIGAYKPGAFIVYDRVPDYWAKDLPVNRGRWNFDHIRYEYYGDYDVGFQAFTAGSYDVREEFSSRIWTQSYNFPALLQGRVKKLVQPDATPSGTQGYFLNTRRPLLKDTNLREALDLAFDFAWANRNLFYGSYLRTVSYFQNSDMMADGVPSPGELKLLEPFRASLPAEVFGLAYVPPMSDGSGDNRVALRKARDLLVKAGYTFPNGALTAPGGAPVRLELLEHEAALLRVEQPYVQALKQLGIAVTIRLVDPTEFERRRKSYDYDIVTVRYSQRLTPGIELRNRYGAVGAAENGTDNFAGVADPAVDAMIEAAISARSRTDLVTAVRALDRVLRAGHYWVPAWYKAVHNLAYWDKFERPKTAPRFQRGVIDTWWAKR